MMRSRGQRLRVAVALTALAIGLFAAGGPNRLQARQGCGSPIWRLGGTPQFADSRSPAVSGDGRFVAFESRALDQTSFTIDIFVFDRDLCTFELISVSSAGDPGNQNSQRPSISGDGRYVAFQSDATNLVPSDTNGDMDIFVRDRELGVTSRVSVTSLNAQTTGGDSSGARISADGTVVAFISQSPTVVPADSNSRPDVFARDLLSGTTERVSVSSAGEQGAAGPLTAVADPVVSADGRFVAFASYFGNLVADDLNVDQDVFVRDRLLGTTVRASVLTDGSEAGADAEQPDISADGRLVFFSAGSPGFVPGNTTCDGIFIRDLVANVTSCPVLDPLDATVHHMADSPKVSADGRFVAFVSTGIHYVAGDTDPGTRDAFVHDRATGITQRASQTQYGDPPNGGHGFPLAISADGVFVAYESFASNLVAGDANNATDVFLADWGSLSALAMVDLARNGSFGAGMQAWQTFATPDASFVVAGVTNGVLEFYRLAPPPATTNQAVVFQRMGAQLLANVPIEARFRLGNSSTARKRLSVLLHDADFSDLAVCTFWLDPSTPLRDYVMRSHTTTFWENATISFYAATAGSDGGAYLLDAVSVVYHPGLDDDVVECLDPTAPPAPGGPPGPSLVGNGDFSAGLAPWATFGHIDWQISEGRFEFVRPPGTPAGVVLQPTGQPMANDTIVTASFYLGNSSSTRKRVTAILHDADFSDLSACTFWLPPGLPLSPYIMRAFATKAWADATISFYPATVGPEGWMQLDDVTWQATPATTTIGTACVEPGANAAARRR